MGIYSIFLRILAASAVCISVAATSANATVLDFTDSAGAGAPGTTAGFFDGANYSLSATGGSISFNPVQDGGTCAILACAGDGLGVGDDEVSAPFFFLSGDALRIDFDKSLTIDGVYLLDLYASFDGTERELARVSYSGGSVDIYADPAETPNGDSGFMEFLFAVPVMTDYLEFRAPRLALYRDELGRNDFSVAGIIATPLPAALPLFGSGLCFMGLLGWLRRRRAAAA